MCSRQLASWSRRWLEVDRRPDATTRRRAPGAAEAGLGADLDGAVLLAAEHAGSRGRRPRTAASASGSRQSTTSSEKRQAMARTVGSEPAPTNLADVRIVRFASPQGMSFGVLDGDGQVAQIEGHPFGQISFTGARYAQADVRLLSPILPSKVVGVGKNYAAHVAEMNTGDAPEGAADLPQAVDLGDRPRRRDPHPAGQHQRAPRGRAGRRHRRPRRPRRHRRSRPPASVFGYTIGNDVTERDMQKSDGQWTRAKGFDSFCPLGPWIETDLGASAWTRPTSRSPAPSTASRARRAAPAS